MGPRVPPIVAARYAASPYSAKASSDSTSRPACALSRTCCATSVGISAAAPVATPRPIAPTPRSPFLRLGSNFSRAVCMSFSALPLATASVVSPRPPLSILLMTPRPNIKYCPASSGTACSAAVPSAFPVSMSTGRPSAMSASA